jgi:16S rRNA (cytosine1402-N4)-methyltransferase
MSGPHEYHTPVLLDELLEQFLHNRGGVFLDGTLGGGGHFWAMAERLDATGTLIGIDRDPEAVSWNRDHSGPCLPCVIIEQSRFSAFDQVLRRHGIPAIDGVLLDLGVSSRQIDSIGRGFSYMRDALLDMRMDPQSDVPAFEFIERSSEAELASALRDFGEVHGALRVARSLKEWGLKKPLKTSFDVRQWCAQTFGQKVSISLLARIFQALRIAVNDELGELKRFLDKVLDFLNPGARLAVISYHSLEDRMVKEFIRCNERTCVCPPELPQCRCTTSPQLKRLTRKALRPSSEEVTRNSRARSARLRIAERTGATK